MMTLEHKAFLLGKDNEPDGRQDALAFRDSLGMFAVADGVSNSFRPDIVAQSLCDVFVNQAPDKLSQWASFSEESLLPTVKQTWDSEVKAYLEGLSGRVLRHETYNLEQWQMGASTFCGIYMDRENGKLAYAVIGDSTLFVIYCDGTFAEYNSNAKVINEAGEAVTEYSNVTAAVLSDNSISGEWFTGEISLEGVCAVTLMTDGMAKWFQKRCKDGLAPFDTLWQLNGMEEFAALAAEARLASEMDDDLAVILIKVAAAEPTPVETPMEQEEKPVNDQEDAQCQESSAMAKEDEAEDTVREEEKTLEETKILESQEETLAGMENPDDREPVHNPKEGLMDWIREGIMRMLKF